jgi:hypothetical protein
MNELTPTYPLVSLIAAMALLFIALNYIWKGSLL